MLITNFHFVEKGWGSETWLVNNNKYCGKILHILKDKINSWHYHKLKTETFYVQSGLIRLFYSWDNDFSLAEQVDLTPNTAFHIEPGLKHRMYGLEESEILEFSTTHYDDDSYKLIAGD